MSTEQTAQEAAREWVDAYCKRHLFRADIEGWEAHLAMRESYLAGYERGMADARKLVSETIEKEAPERRKLSRIADKENE